MSGDGKEPGGTPEASHEEPTDAANVPTVDDGAETEEEQEELRQEDLPEFHPDRIRVAGGFMLRVPALALDAIFLGLMASVVQAFLVVRLEELEPKAWLVGFWLVFLYFFLCYSPLLGGRSLGKRLMQLHVLDADGHPPGVGRAAFRAFFITLVLFFRPLVTFMELAAGPANGLMTWLLIATIAGSLFMGIMMDPLKQAWHDRLTGLYVIQREGLERFKSGAWQREMWEKKGHLRRRMGVMAWAVGLFLALCTGGFFLPPLPKDENGFLKMGPVHSSPENFAATRYLYWKKHPTGQGMAESLWTQPGVLAASVEVSGQRGAIDAPTLRVWLITLRLSTATYNQRTARISLFDHAHELARQLVLDGEDVDVVRLGLQQGPDMGVLHNTGARCVFQEPVWARTDAPLPSSALGGDFCR